MTEAAFGRFTYNQYEGTSILAGGRKVEVLLPPVTLSLGVVQNRKNEWLEVEVLQYVNPGSSADFFRDVGGTTIQSW